MSLLFRFVLFFTFFTWFNFSYETYGMDPSSDLPEKSMKPFSYSAALKKGTDSTVKQTDSLGEVKDTLVMSTSAIAQASAELPLPMKGQLTVSDPLAIEYRNSCNYHYSGEYHNNLYFFKRSGVIFERSFLQELKEKLHHAPDKPDHFPNVCKGLLTVHYQVGKENKTKRIPMRNIFVSGGKYFYRSDFSFQQEYGCVTAVNTVLEQYEKDAFYHLAQKKGNSTQGLFLQAAINKKLQEIVSENWQERTGICSESIFLLHLKKEALFKTMDIILEEERRPITIHAIVLGISSYRYCCPLCQDLIQNFQRMLPKLLVDFSKKRPSRIFLDEGFSTLAMIAGYTREGDYVKEDQVFLREDLVLNPSEHKLISIKFPVDGELKK